MSCGGREPGDKPQRDRSRSGLTVEFRTVGIGVWGTSAVNDPSSEVGLRLLHRTRTTVPARQCDALRLIDAALGFASQHERVSHRDAVRLLEALRDELECTPNVGRAAADADQLLARLPFGDGYRRRDLMDALLDLRRVAQLSVGVTSTSPPA